MKGFSLPQDGQLHHSPRFQPADHTQDIARAADLSVIHRQDDVLL